MKLEQVQFCGEPAVRGSNGVLDAILVPGWGSNLISLKYVPKQLELLRTPESAEQFWSVPVLYGIPVLFPPNRIEDGMFIYEGRTYRFDINEPEDNNHSHGLLFEQKWELVSAEVVDNVVRIESRFRSADYPEMIGQFPHQFEVTLLSILDGRTLRQEMTVVNESHEAMPCGIGYHTTSRFPFRPGDPLDACRFQLTADQHWELNRRFLPTGIRSPIAYGEQLRSGMSLSGMALDDVYSAAPCDGRNEAVLDDPGAGLRVSYRCGDDSRFWVVYNDDSMQGYVCPEPYTWVTNAPNVNLPAEQTGFRALQPGERITVTTEIMVEEIRTNAP